MKKLPHFLLAIGLLLTLCSSTNGTSDPAGQQTASDPSSDEAWPASAINLVVPASAGGGRERTALRHGAGHDRRQREKTSNICVT